MEGSKKMKKVALILFVFSLLFWLNPEKKMAAENLQRAIDSMKAGAVLKLENKTYEGNLTIRKPITMIGAGKTVIKGDGKGNTISVKAPHVTLSRLTVAGSSMNRNSSEEYAAIKIFTNDNTVDHVTIRDSFHGVYLSQAHQNTIANNTIMGIDKGEVAGQGNGIQVYYAHDNLLVSNTIDGTRDGMFFDYASNNRIYNNHISNTRYGLHYMYSDENVFEKNIFTMNTGGAAIMNSNHIKLKNNQFIFNYGNQSFGLLLLQATDNEIEKNTFYMNQRGIYLDQATRNLFRRNKIVQNQIGVELWSSSNQQTFTENQITDNTLPAVTVAGQGEDNAWSKDGKGNDWGSAFPLTDLNQDGIGDFAVSYESSLHQLIEDQELTSFFLKSPALKIYEKMNSLLERNDVMFTDQHPLITRKGHPLRTAVIGALVLLAAWILLKGRKRLCITFGRNGKKI